MKIFNSGDTLKTDGGVLYTYVRRHVVYKEECVLSTDKGILCLKHESYLTKVGSITNRDVVSILEKE